MITNHQANGHSLAESGRAARWIETGVPQLDRVLGGGFLRGSLGMVIGAPGAGKTVMAQQMAFHWAAQGSTTLFLTGYSETHEKLFDHTRDLTFFKPELIGSKIHFASLLDFLREGSEETQDAIIEMVRSHEASFVVIDGFRGMRRLLTDDQSVAHFLYSLGARLALLGATTLLIVEGEPDESARYPEITVCDVVLNLRRDFRAGRERRLLQVMKARGTSPLGGVHPYAISRDGFSVFPRFETTMAASADAVWTSERAPFGIKRLDRILGGGLTAGTSTLVAGSPGVGKTALGLHFVAEGARVEPTLFLGFMESAAQLREQGRTFGLDLAASEASGLLRFLILPGYDIEADYVAGLVADDIERRGTRRLVVDSAADLERALGDHERKPGFLSALIGYLRDRRVTTYFTLGMPTIAGPTLELAEPLSVVAENLLLMRNVEYRAQLHRVFSVLKMRFSDHDRAIYEYAITADQGIDITGPAPLGEGLLTGMARPLVDIPMTTSSAGFGAEPQANGR